MFWWAVGCSGPLDPRPEMRARMVETRVVALEPERALAEGNLYAACVGFKQRVRLKDAEADWQRLLLVAARDPECLPAPDGSALAGWAAGRAGWTDPVAEWNAGHGAPVDVAGISPSTRLRLALRGPDAREVRSAAEEALRTNPKDAFACATLVRDAIARGELAEAESLSHCTDSPELLRLRAQALDEGGRYAEAVATYDRAGFGLHAAAILYQSLGDTDGAVSRMDERVPPVAIHRAWMALLRGEVPEISGLDDSPEATMIRALTGDSPALAHLDDMPGDEPRLVRARVAADAGALAESLAEHPFSPGRRAASVMQAVERGAAGLGGTTVPAAAEAVAALDIDHLRLAGDAGRREAPLVALLPGPWGSLPEMLRMVPAGVPTGRDEVGDAWRAAVELDPIDRDDALAALQAEHPELRVLARVRARIAWGLPPLPGDPRPGPEPPPSDSPLDAPEAPR